MSNVFKELQLYDLVELLETGKPRALRPVIPLSEMEKIRNPSYRPTKFCSETEVLLINYSEGGTVGNVTQRIGSFFKGLNSQSNVTTLEAKGIAELLENLSILKKRMCEGESNDLEEIKKEALLKEHLKEMKAKRVKDTFVWSTMAGRPVRVFSKKTPDKEMLSKHLKDVIEKRQQWTNQMKPKLERKIKQNEEELQRKHNKLQISLSAILEKWICYDEGWLKGLCQAGYLVSFLKANKTFIAMLLAAVLTIPQRGLLTFGLFLELTIKQPPNGLNSFYLYRYHSLYLYHRFYCSKR